MNTVRRRARVPFPLWELPERGQSLTSNHLLGSTPDFSSGLSPEVFSTSGFFRKTAGFEIRVLPLLGELPKAIEPHMPICQLYRWQLGPSMWTLPTAKSLDLIVVTALGVGFPGEATDPPHVDLPAIVRSQWRGKRRRQDIYIYTKYTLYIYILYIYMCVSCFFLILVSDTTFCVLLLWWVLRFS